MQGAIGVNENDGSFFSDFIRLYTAEQNYLRTGKTLDYNKLQETSDEIAENFVTDILNAYPEEPNLNLNNELPPLERIGSYDAGAAASKIFNGNFSPWAGSILFPFLGDGGLSGQSLSDSLMFKFLLDTGTSTEKLLSGLYDLVSAAQASWNVVDGWGRELIIPVMSLVLPC